MYQPKLFYQNVPYQDKLLDFYYKAYQKGYGNLQGFGLYDSNELITDAGHKNFFAIYGIVTERTRYKRNKKTKNGGNNEKE